MATTTKAKKKSSGATKSPKTPKVTPLSDRVLIRPEEALEKTEGGILLPDSAQEKPLQGKVIAVGPGALNEANGSRTELNVSVADTVLFGKYSGAEIKIDGVEYTIVREGDLLGVLED